MFIKNKRYFLRTNKESWCKNFFLFDTNFEIVKILKTYSIEINYVVLKCFKFCKIYFILRVKKSTYSAYVYTKWDAPCNFCVGVV